MTTDVEPIVMPDEAWILMTTHTSEADYARDCKATKTKIANKVPLYKFGSNQTKADWLKDADEWGRRRKYHRARARHWKKYLKA